MATMTQKESVTSDSGHDGGNYGHESEDSSKSNLLRGFGIFDGLSSKKKLKADGTAPKRRGPKPDSKPALTRRQELNRQAQRTHRERKELYIKALEQQVLRLKDTYGTVCRDRDAFVEENRILRQVLASHGIHCPADLATPRQPVAAPDSSSGSFSGSYAHSPITDDQSPPPVFHQVGSPNGPSQNGSRMQPQRNFNVDEVGINFVLALERPCMDHMQMLCVKSQESEEDFSGHALMATCPPQRHLLEHPETQYPHQLHPDLLGENLLKLLDLSNRLPLNGEITPVMAWISIYRDPRFDQLKEVDVTGINADLIDKVRCYGFGAVLEEFEVKDALERLFAQRMEISG